MGWGSFQKAEKPLFPYSHGALLQIKQLLICSCFFFFFFRDSVVPGWPEAVLYREDILSWDTQGADIPARFHRDSRPHSYGIPYIWNLFSELYERYQHQAPTWLPTFFSPRSCRWVKCFLGVVEVISEAAFLAHGERLAGAVFKGLMPHGAVCGFKITQVRVSCSPDAVWNARSGMGHSC